MRPIEDIMKYEGFTNPELLSKQDSVEVYKVILGSDPAILKTHREELKFYREVTTLQSLEKKNAQTPKIYSIGIHAENSSCFPFYFLEEFLPGKTLLETFSSYGYKQKCDILYKCGQLLCQLNVSMSKYDLEKSGLWKYAYKGVETYDQYSWSELYVRQMPFWIENIRSEELPKNTEKQVGKIYP